jgi:hypothetical protein
LLHFLFGRASSCHTIKRRQSTPNLVAMCKFGGDSQSLGTIRLWCRVTGANADFMGGVELRLRNLLPHGRTIVRQRGPMKRHTSEYDMEVVLYITP